MPMCQWKYQLLLSELAYCLIGTLAHYLDGESVEASVYGDHGTGYECGGVARQPL